MEDSALIWMMNNPYCVTAIVLVVFCGIIALVVDCWQKWR